MNEDGVTDGVSVTSVDGAETGGEGRIFMTEASPNLSVERKSEPLHLKTKPVPAIVMLLGGGIVAADIFIQQLEFRKSLIIILVSLVFFLIVGELVKFLLDRIELPDPEAVDADGNVIQKGRSGESEGAGGNPGENEESPGNSGE
ncbi:MAG: hypothetical protein IJT24_06030 [Lachnospiraceae bacterium]|nr:hypothetical protein [Lachnospiraceae bacterium]